MYQCFQENGIAWEVGRIELSLTDAPLEQFVFVYDNLGNLIQMKVDDAHDPSNNEKCGDDVFDGSDEQLMVIGRNENKGRRGAVVAVLLVELKMRMVMKMTLKN
jgi:hypothetical protein